MVFKKGIIFLSAVAVTIWLQGCGGTSGGSSSGDGSGNNPNVDNIPPVITLKGNKYIRLFVGDTFSDPGATARDNIDGDITALLDKNSTVDTSVPGNYKVTYFVSDKAGNSAKEVRKVKVFFRPLSKVYINEFSAANTITQYDPDYFEFSDWIELYNSGNNPVDISGYALSDDKTKQPWKIPAGTVIPAHEYIIFWADKQDKKAKALHTNFSLGRKGEEVILYDNNGKLIDQISYTKQKADISYGRNQSLLWEYMDPSFKKANTPGAFSATRAEKPVFSVTGGFYNSVQNVSISSIDNGTIYYTLDGSFPTKNSTRYTRPITINKTSTLRAVEYKDGLVKSKDQTMTYLLNWDTTIPVVSLSTDPKYLFDDMIGIYVTGKNGRPLYQCRASETEKHNYAQDWKRPVHIEYFDKEKTEGFSFNLDISITGQCSRHNHKKSFSMELDGKYGKSSLKYKLYENKDLKKIMDFRLRTGDSQFRITDILASALVEAGHLDIDYQSYRAPVQLFINNKYWGLYNIREKKGKDFLKSNYPDIDTENIDLVGVKVKAGDKKAYNQLHNFVTDPNNDFSLDENYQKVIDQIDEKNFIDYMILEIYSGNSDWVDNNFRVWRERDKPGAKWRWILEDEDYGFVVAPETDSLAMIKSKNGTLIRDLFLALLKNDTFKSKFKNRFNELLDTLFAPENVLSIVNKIVEERRPYMDIEPSEWGITLNDFDYDLNQNIKPFIQKRAEELKNQLNQY